jgi:hypothetical protein
MVTDIQKIDPDWWLVKNEAGQVNLFSSEGSGAADHSRLDLCPAITSKSSMTMLLLVQHHLLLLFRSLLPLSLRQQNPRLKAQLPLRFMTTRREKTTNCRSRRTQS